MQRTILGMTVALLLYAVPARADHVHINEIYSSHDGTDTLEFIELIGTPGASLDGLSMVVIEGDASSNEGALDRVWSLDGETIPLNGYFVLGDIAVSNNDFDIGVSNRLENGTNTYVLVEDIFWVLNDDIDADDDGVADGPLGVLIHDLIAPVDGGINNATPDKTYYGADIRGPDGTFLPAGILRTFDYPNDWAFKWLDFDPVANTAFERTPGEPNVPEPASLALLMLGAAAGLRRRR